MLVWSAFFVFGIVSIVTPVVLPEIARSFSSNYAQGGGLEAGRNLALGLILISAGLFAQRWGKKFLLGFGFFLAGGGLIVMSIAGNYLELLLGMVIVGLGCGLIEALLSPLITDIHPGDAGPHMNFSHAFFHIGVVLSVILFGELMMQDVSWRLVYLVVGVTALAVGCSIYATRFPPLHGCGDRGPRSG